MAKFFCRVKVFSRGRGGRITRAAAYRAGERIRDERTSHSYNYSKRQDIVHTEITLPSDLANRPDMEWARDRTRLWNEVEMQSDRRKADSIVTHNTTSLSLQPTARGSRSCDVPHECRTRSSHVRI